MDQNTHLTLDDVKRRAKIILKITGIWLITMAADEVSKKKKQLHYDTIAILMFLKWMKFIYNCHLIRTFDLQS